MLGIQLASGVFVSSSVFIIDSAISISIFTPHCFDHSSHCPYS